MSAHISTFWAGLTAERICLEPFLAFRRYEIDSKIFRRGYPYS